MKSILIINDYKAPFPGAFIPGQIQLAKFLKEKGIRVVFIFPEEKAYLEELKETSKIYIVPFFSGVKFNYRFYRLVKKIVREEKISIIHTNFGFSGFLTASLLSVILRVKHISHERALPHGIIKSSGVMRLFKRVFFMTLDAISNNYYIAISQEIRANLSQYLGLSPKKITVVSNAVTGKAVEAVSLDTKGKKVIGMVAHWGGQKDHKTFIEAAAMVRAKRSDILFLQVGGELRNRKADYYPNLEKWIDSVNAGELFHFTGEVSNPASYINKMDVCCLISHYEGFGNAAVEYMLLKKPVIATAVGGLKDIVVDGKTGYLIEPNNARELADKILYLLDNPEVAYTMGVAGFERASELFSNEKWVEQVYSIYLKTALH